MALTSTVAESRERLAARLIDARSRTDELFALLTPAALYERPIPERHRLVFYLGHVEAFDWNLIAKGTFGIGPFNDAFDKLFAFGIDPVDGGLPNEPASDWPRREAIDDYNHRVRAIVDECVNGNRPAPDGADLTTLFNMAIEHRLMHAETLAYLLHQLDPSGKRAPADAPLVPPATTVRPERVRIPSGAATLGRRRERGFGWDNEFDEHRVEVPEFSIEVLKITNARYLEFVQEGGYNTPRFWAAADWAWIESQKIKHPRFWLDHGGSYSERGMFSHHALSLEAPVYVSHAEASAFARWASGALPTEAQFHRAAYGTPQGDERDFPWGSSAPAAQYGNFDFHRWDTTPVGAFPAGDSAFGVSEMVGNGWEWTSTLLEPFAGFTSHPLYAGYSANFFDGSHYVVKGGSPRTAACMLRRSFRNWFQPHYPYLYGTFRLVHP